MSTSTVNTQKEKVKVPADWLQGLKENWQADMMSGFMVALLALPLSLGIASASDFPNPLYGVLTAIIGGIFVSFFMGARLTIKGPAAGLIVIVAGAVSEFGGGVPGWHLALGAIVVAAVLQILFGVFKLGKLSDFFPLSAVHGMLAAIGLIIMSKQLHVLMGVNPVFADGPAKGKPMVSPLDLLSAFPNTVDKLIHDSVLESSLIVGLICLVIVFVWPLIKNPIIKKIPAPLVVLLVAIPLGMLLGLTQENKELVKVGKFFDILGFQASFEGFGQMGVFIKYVALFAIIGSLESLLTAKAIDILDPYKRKTDFDRDLMAVGGGNAIAGMLGGLPMISEVARSSSNVNNGAKTRWANLFHGIFLLIFVALLSSVIELVPKAALAALLIGVGFKLAHPREFKHMYKIGVEQLIIFLITIFFTLYEDLLVGIAAGIIAKFVIELVIGASLKNMFVSRVAIHTEGDRITAKILGDAVFSNYLGIKKKLYAIEKEKHLEIDFSECKVVDHSVMENLHTFENDYRSSGGHCHIVGLDYHKARSPHPLAVRINKEVKKKQ
jgi:MFS superfamily sulfate permease-like transporter